MSLEAGFLVAVDHQRIAVQDRRAGLAETIAGVEAPMSACHALLAREIVAVHACEPKETQTCCRR